MAGAGDGLSPVGPAEFRKLEFRLGAENGVAQLCHADLLIIFTDIEGLYDANPRSDPNARLISRVDAIDDKLRAIAGGPGTAGGTGGMATKLSAAQLCMDSGISMLICKGDRAEVLYDIVEGKKVGTLFKKKEGLTHA